MTRAEILAIGDELVHGSALDTNSRHIARELEAAGLPIHRFTVASDDPLELQRVLGEACGRSRVVVATGGLGPTEDDRTREAAAVLLGVPLELHRESLQSLEEFARRRKRPMPESNRRQIVVLFQPWQHVDAILRLECPTLVFVNWKDLWQHRRANHWASSPCSKRFRASNRSFNSAAIASGTRS